jgi:putative tricarboxylic transport membrane protein
MNDRRGKMNLREMISGAASLLIAALVFMTSLRLGVGALHDPGPGFVLFLASISLAICACILLCIGFSRKTQPALRPETGNRTDRRNALIVMAALIAYCLALPKLGYPVSTFVLMLVLFGLGRMKPGMVVLGSLITVLLSYCLFGHLLGTPLPRGVLGF